MNWRRVIEACKDEADRRIAQRGEEDTDYFRLTNDARVLLILAQMLEAGLD